MMSSPLSLVAVLLALVMGLQDSVPAKFEPGCFLGEVSHGPSRLLVRICAQGGDKWSVLGSLIQAGLIDKECTDIVAEGDQLACTLDVGGVPGRFEGQVSADGSTYTGMLTLKAAGQKPSRLPFVLQRWARPQSLANCRRFKGVLAVPGGEIRLSIAVADAGGGMGTVATIDIAEQGVKEWPLMVAPAAAGELKLVLTVGAPAVYTLRANEDGTMSGSFEQGGFKAPLTLTPIAAGEQVGSARPQDPQPPFPYESREVRVTHPAFTHTLAGTLTVPPHDAGTKLPAVLLIAGSGPNDRDESIMGHKPFLVLADALTRDGYAVLRMDKRGVGSSGGSFASATTLDFAVDADAAAEWLKQQPEIDPDKVAVLGHSEGATCAAQVARWQWEEKPTVHPVAAVVLMAGPGRPGHEILRWQTARIMEAEGIDAARGAEARSLHGAFLDATIAGEDDAALESKALALLRAQVALSEAPSPADGELEKAAKATVAQMKSPWMKLFLTLDPRTALSGVPCPVLAIAGTLDTQVDSATDLANIEEALRHSGSAAAITRREGLNHLFQPAKTGSPSEYGSIETTMDQATILLIDAWLNSIIRPAK